MDYWRLDNTEGYTQAELDTLNAELHARYEAGEWPGATKDEAAKWFADDVARR